MEVLCMNQFDVCGAVCTEGRRVSAPLAIRFLMRDVQGFTRRHSYCRPQNAQHDSSDSTRSFRITATKQKKLNEFFHGRHNWTLYAYILV